MDIIGFLIGTVIGNILGALFINLLIMFLEDRKENKLASMQIERIMKKREEENKWIELDF